MSPTLRSPRRLLELLPVALAATWALASFTAMAVLWSGEPVFNSEGFIERSREPLWSLRFFTSDRPFTTDLFFKLAGSDPANSVVLHQAMNALAWPFLGLCVSRRLTPRWLQLSCIVFFASLANWWNIAGWTYVMRSESLSLSLLAIWLGALVLWLDRPGTLPFIALAAATLVFSFTRDNLPVFLLAFASGLVALCWIARRHRRASLWLLALCLVVATLQQASARAGHRHQFPLLNVVFQRILPVPNRVAWFEAHGMPVPADLLTWAGAWASSRDWAMYRDPRYRPFADWSLHEGQRTYARFLLVHPGYALMEPLSALPQLYPVSMAHDFRPRPKHLLTWLPERLWNRTLAILGSLTVALLCGFAFPRTGDPLSAVPPALLGATVANAFFIFHADAMEVPRHSVMTPVLTWLVFSVGSCALADLALRRRRSAPSPAAAAGSGPVEGGGPG